MNSLLFKPLLGYFGLILVLFCFLIAFSACFGARLGALNSGNKNPLPEAPPPSVKRTDAEKQKELEQNKETAKEPEPDNPKEFNYFPYDLQVDTISYLTCSTNQYWHIQAGAYFSRSGLRLSEYFLDKMPSMNADNMESLIKSSTKHKAMPYLAVRYKNNLLNFQQPQVPFNSGMRLPDLIPNLVQNNKVRLKEYNRDPIKANIVQPIFVNNDLTRDQFDSQLVLALYYTNTQDNTMIHKPEGVRGKDIYGRTYTLGLTDLDLVANDAADRYALTSVVETKLPEAPAQAEWVCPSALRLQIRRHPTNAYNPRDWYNAQNNNYRQNYPSLQSALEATNPAHRPMPAEPSCEDSNSGGSALEVARAVLGNNWNINIGRSGGGCISPKNSRIHCYWMSTRNNVSDRLELRPNSECSIKYGGADIVKHCPRFLSICVRKN